MLKKTNEVERYEKTFVPLKRAEIKTAQRLMTDRRPPLTVTRYRVTLIKWTDSTLSINGTLGFFVPFVARGSINSPVSDQIPRQTFLPTRSAFFAVSCFCQTKSVRLMFLNSPTRLCHLFYVFLNSTWITQRFQRIFC